MAMRVHHVAGKDERAALVIEGLTSTASEAIDLRFCRPDKYFESQLR
jgi:hypothetical protein